MDDKQRSQSVVTTDAIRGLLLHMGVQAEVQLDTNNQPLIIMHAEQFNLNRMTIETWFTLEKESEAYCYLRERMRGTGNTI